MKAPATVITASTSTNINTSATSSNGGDESFCSSNTNFTSISSASEMNSATMDNTHHLHQQQQQQTPSSGSGNISNISNSGSGSGSGLLYHQASASTSGNGTGDGPGASRINGVNTTNNGNGGNSNSGGSYIKASLSMTSLPPDEQQEGREVIKAKLRVERPYNSLKKKRNTDRDTWRHSWGSGHSHSSCSLHSNATTGGIIGLVSGKDEFWAALQTNYNYIMDTNLLDTCKEARCEIEGAASITKNATENCLKMLDTSRSEGSSEDPKELRKWLREMESKLEEAPTLSEATQFSIEELQRRLDEHSVLYREIVSHARVVGACIKASEKKNNLASDEQQQQNSSLSSTDEKSSGAGPGTGTATGASDLTVGGKTPSPNGKEAAKQKTSNNEGNLKGLEHRYHLLYLKAIEVQCLFEGLLGKKISAANLLSRGATTSEETDEEPASKLARLSDSESDDSTHSADHRAALRTAECCKKVAKKSNCIKTDYADGDDEDDGEDEIDHPQSGHSTANWSSLSFNTVLTQERVHHCCITTSLASTDFDADSEGSDYEVIKRPRRSEKYPTSGAANPNNYRCLLSTPVRNHNIVSFNPFHSQLVGSENDSVFVLSDSMDSKSLMQSKLLNGSAAGGAGELSKQSPQPLQQQHNSPKLLNISNHNIARLSPQQQQHQQQQLQNQLLLVNSKSGTAATSTVLTTSPCSNGGGGVVGNSVGGNGNIGCTVAGNGNTPVSAAVTLTSAAGIRKRHRNIDISKFNESNRKSNSCAIFYFKHLDTDNETNFSGGGLSSSHGSDISKSAEPSSDDDEGWLYSNSAEHCIDGSHRQTKILVNQDKSHHHHHHHLKANNSSSQLSTNDDSDKENKTGTAVPSILANANSNSNSSISNSNSNQTTPSIRSSSSLNSSSQIAITEIQLNGGGGGSSNYSGSTTGSFIGCAATSTTVVMHRSVMELQLGSNNSISQSGSTNKTSRSPNRSVQSKENQFVDPTTPTKCYYSKFETKPVCNGKNVSPRTLKKSGNTVTTATFEVSSAKEVSHESIKQLVLGAEHLVRDDAMKTPTKQIQQQQQQKHSIVKISSTIKKREVIMPGPAKQRIEEWLEHQPICIKQEPQVASVPTTDCEASGEASETDSVARESDSSEGFTDSVATCMQTTGGSNSYGNSIEHIGGSAEPIPTVGSNQSLNATSKVLRRQNRRKNDRPWSVSCLSQLTETNAQIGSKAQASQAGLATHSISESALDSLSPGRQRNDTQPSISVKNTESKNSLKRRKIRKKKQLAKKNESGSDGMLQMKKTESLSSGQTIQEITAALLNLPKSNLEAGEEQTLMKPNFRVGSYTTAYMTNETKLGSLAALATYMNEEDPQGEYTTGTEDHHSSFSETAWDNYQEKYNSENYSEGFDSDAARRLLEFGDDYRNFLDSQSDCCSSLSAANNLDSMSPPQMDSLKQSEAKVVIQETIVSSVDHARRRRALELEYERRRKNLEVRRKSCQDDIIQNIRSPTASLSSSANALTPKNNEKFSFMARVDSASRKLDFGMSHSAQSLRRTSESDTSSRRRRADDRRRSSRNLEKSIKLIPATSSSSEEHTDDEKEMKNLLTQSKNRLEDTRSLKIRSHLLRPEDYAEIIATCRDNIRCLDSVLRGPPGTVMSAGCLNATKDLLSSWEELLAWSENAAAARKMQEEMIILKSSLNRLGGKLACDLDTEPSIQLSIEALKNEKSQLQTYRTNMLRLNASVHSWLTRQERKLAAELAEHEEAIKSATEATLQSSETQQLPESSNNDAVDNNNKKSVGTIAFDQDKHSQITTIIQSESEFHKHLKNEVSEMYSAWDEANSRINNQLEVLTTSLIAWRQLESGLYEFQQVLGKDRGTLKGLEGALDKGKTTPVELAQNVKLVAKLLSEKVEVSQEQLTAVQEHLDPSRILHIAQFTASNGSLSDSGISDGATSDGGLSERERRLGVLRRLAKQLESALAPGSEAMKSIAARMESAEFDLKSLQNTCRDLIVRTAASHTKKSVQNGSGGDDRPPSKKNSPSSSPSSKRRNKRSKKSAAIAAANLGEADAAAYNVALATSPDAGDPDDPYNEDTLDFDSSDDENKTGKPGWVKRIAKIAFPMQVALFTLICAACMMQPNCCDNLNNLSMSFTPQLRYIRGPPPI